MDNRQFPNDTCVERIETDASPRHSRILVSTFNLSDQWKLVGTRRVHWADVDVEIIEEAPRRYQSMAMRLRLNCSLQGRNWRVTSRSPRNAVSWHSSGCVGSWWALDVADGHSSAERTRQRCEATLTQTGLVACGPADQRAVPCSSTDSTWLGRPRRR